MSHQVGPEVEALEVQPETAAEVAGAEEKEAQVVAEERRVGAMVGVKGVAERVVVVEA